MYSHAVAASTPFQIPITSKLLGGVAFAPHAASSSGDPHMSNIKGELFDVKMHGFHTLLQVPRFAPPEAALLRVEGEVRNFGNCRMQYLKRLNITGQWAEGIHKDGIFLDSDTPNRYTNLHLKHSYGQEFQFGPIAAKVEFHYTKKGLSFLNFYVTSVGDIQVPIGGILGLDDHAYATKGACNPIVANLIQESQDIYPRAEDEVHENTGSFAMVSLA